MTQKPRTYNGDLANLPAALAPLTEQRRWVNWSWDWRARKNGGGKWTKPPRQAHAPEQFAKSDDPATWGTYEQALDNVTAGRANGIGFALKGSNIGAIDIDHCVDPREDKLVSWAEQLHEEAAYAYQEVTVSGGGLRIIGTADGPEIHRKFTFDRKTGAGIELYRNTARYITVSGLEMGSCAALPPLDEFIDRLIARHTGQARDGLDFNHAAPQTFNNYDDIIRNGAPQGERSELFQAVIWHFAGKGRTAEEITDELAQYPNGIAAKYADRLHDEVTRSYEKWRAGARSRATGSVADGSAHPWPQIFVTPGELPRVVNEAEDALLALNREIYQRGGMIVRPVLSDLKAADNRDTQGWRLIPMTRPHLVETLTRAARFLKYDGRSKDWVAIDAPDKIADAYLARQGAWKLPRLSGIINTPFIRIDGSVCEKLGYDHASELLFKSDGQDFPPIPQHPGKADALEALKAVVSLISSFPFVSDADRSTALEQIQSERT